MIRLSLLLFAHAALSGAAFSINQNANFEISYASQIVVDGSGIREAFELSDVTLDDDTFQAKAAQLNTKYLLKLDADRLLYVFRDNANLPSPGVPFHGTWESPGCELRGHFVGHYLTAISMVVMSTGDATAKERLLYLIDELAKVQAALDEGGYLSAFPSEHFDRVEAIKGVWAPYYVIHKIMAGLLDAYTMTGSKKAMTMLLSMTDYFYKRITKVIAEQGAQHWQHCLNIEFGGMNDVMYRLYAVTRNESHFTMATYFDKINFLEPLSSNTDILGGLHANTHLAQVVGFAEGYEVKKEAKALSIVKNFFAMITANHSYATGGSNDKEFWFQANILAESILDSKDSLETQEICTQYNIMKIARSLFRWTGDVRLADFYERALVNGILGVSRMTNDDVHAGHHHHHHDHVLEGHHHHHSLSLGTEHLTMVSSANPLHYHRSKEAREAELAEFDKEAADEKTIDEQHEELSLGQLPAVTHRRAFSNKSQDYWGFNLAKMPNNEHASNAAGTPGVFLYLLTLGAGRSKGDNYHHWGYPEHSFWCCYGTAIEAFAKLADSIYFKAPAKGDAVAKLYVNQLVSSRLNWRDMGVVMAVKAYGFEPGPSVSATVNFTVNPPPPLAGNNAEAAEEPGVQFSLMLRIPGWARMGMTVLKVNGVEWRRCPSSPSPGSYCNIVRSWRSGDVLTIVMGLAYWSKPLPDTRTEYASLKAFMMGPHVMAGLTHDSRHIRMAAPLDGGSFSEPGDEEELLSLQAGWNSSLYLRHDMYHIYMSAIEDNGDAIDATFRLMSGCSQGGGKEEPEQQRIREHAADLGLAHSRKLASSSETKGAAANADQLNHMRQQMKLGLHDDVSVLLESMNFPGFYVGNAYQDTTMTISQPDSTTDDGTRSSPSSESMHSASSNANVEGNGFCSAHQWVLRPGLDGQKGTLSLESVAKPGFYLSAFMDDHPPVTCTDLLPNCDALAKKGLCVTQPEVHKIACRKSCYACGALNGALSLHQLKPGDKRFASVTSFRLATPLTPHFPLGSKVLTGANRRYLTAPLGNLVDERYTVYFDVQGDSSSKSFNLNSM